MGRNLTERVCSLSRKGLYTGPEEAFNRAMGLVNVLYDSDNFCVAEFAAGGGIELVDKHACRSGYLEGQVAARLRACMARLQSDAQDEDTVDEFLCTYEALLTNSVRLH
jgi:hypothetical protein